MSDDSIITAKSPINIGIIKYFNEPGVKSLYPINDYITALVDPRIISARTSVCARREFTDDQFWLNGRNCGAQLEFFLNEVKYRAATQKSVSVEFLTRKVHVACENNFLPSWGPSAFAAGFISLMAALCRLYKIRPNSVLNRALFPDACQSYTGGFVARRELYTTRRNYKGKLIAQGKNWPELRVLIVVCQIPKKPPAVEASNVQKLSEHMRTRIKENVSNNLKTIAGAIKGRNFTLFASTLIRDNNQYHAVNISTYSTRFYKKTTSIKIADVIDSYNKMSNELRAAYTFDAGPNISLFFLEKHAREVISLIKYMFPTSNSSFIKGLEVPADLDPEQFKDFPVDPAKKANQVKFAIYTKIGDASVIFDTKNHLLTENGDLVAPKPSSLPPNEDSSSTVSFNQIPGFGFEEDGIPEMTFNLRHLDVS